MQEVNPFYIQLIREYPLTSIKTKEQYIEASERLVNVLKQEKHSGQEMYCGALADLIVCWELEHFRQIFKER